MSYLRKRGVVHTRKEEFVGTIVAFRMRGAVVELRLAGATVSCFSTYHRRWIGTKFFRLVLHNPDEDFTEGFVLCDKGRSLLVKDPNEK